MASPAMAPVRVPRSGLERFFRPEPRTKPKADIVWTHELVFGLADVRCAQCLGRGIRGRGNPCGCVLRKIFRICAAKYEAARADAVRYSQVHWSRVAAGPKGARTYSFRRVEFVADFDLIARRRLDSKERRILYEHILGDLTANELAPRLGMSRGNFFHAVYRIMARLGAAFAETRPYPLYPVDEYFS